MRQLGTRFTRGMSGIKNEVRKDVGGNVMPMAAIGIVALAGMIGGGVDVSRGYMAQNRMQNACDAGVLAGRKAVGSNGYDTAAQAEADTYFETNFDATGQDVKSLSFTTTTPDGGNTIKGTATANMDTVIMRIFGFSSIPVKATCDASMSIGNSDVMLVLDTTGSMDYPLDSTQTRMEALQDAVKSFYATVSTAADGGNGRLRIGILPYSSTVNVGSLIMAEDPAYIVDNHDYQSREAVFTTETENTLTGYGPPVTTNVTEYSGTSNGWWYYSGGTGYSNNASCESNRPSDVDWANNGGSSSSTSSYTNGDGDRIEETTTTQPQRYTQYICYYNGSQYRPIVRYRYRNIYETERVTEEAQYSTTTTTVFDKWEYKQINYDTSLFKGGTAVTTATAYNGGNMISTWGGCIEERDTKSVDGIVYNALSAKITPDGMDDLDIDKTPTSDDATKWRPMWEQISYRRLTNSGYSTYATTSSNGTNPQKACPYQAQELQKWSSQADFDVHVDALDADGGTYHDIGMLWGVRMLSTNGIFSGTVNAAPANNGAVSRHIVFMTDGTLDTGNNLYSAYGVERHDQRVTDDGYSSQDSRHIARFRAICDATKAKGIRVWVIAYTAALTTDLQYCASPQSSFVAANSTQLNDAFQSIGQTVGELRIVQ
ncbi:pilus assembly protein TadG-related protein [Altererythrobacter sp. ZODW24]|uniref:TadE/TadG family type IV pilus assembly protein n=1 Tax=Altererythrobacter sp. ZODW24 TaxID=2185142 RepID=UPI000DF7F619|nr:pilus assembly protein TadG-related protein [Altererythrobacter sp. ZODW24]